MKFGQLIKYNRRYAFVKKSYPKRGGETIPRPLSKKSKIEHISGSIVQSFKQFVFTVC